MGRYHGRRVMPSCRQWSWQHQGRRVLPPPPWRRPLLLLLTAVLLVSGGLLGRDLYCACRERAAYEALARRVHEAEPLVMPLSTQDAASGETSPSNAPEEEPARLPSPFEALASENPDLAGWLTIADTAVDYPVMWTPEDPEYYLRHAFDKSRAASGSLFIGAGCRPDGAHVIIYGHNMRDGSMFGSLSGYKSADYAAAHPVIRFDTLTRAGEYRVLSAFYSHAYTPGEEGFRYYQYTDLSQAGDFEAYVRQAKEAALYDTGTRAEYGDRLLTLSTCSYHQENGTFVVVAAAAPDGGLSGQTADTMGNILSGRIP